VDIQPTPLEGLLSLGSRGHCGAQEFSICAERRENKFCRDVSGESNCYLSHLVGTGAHFYSAYHEPLYVRRYRDFRAGRPVDT
jgi:hypothetical protein